MGFFDRIFGSGRSSVMITSADVDSRTFTVTTVREGYDREQVSEFLNRAVATLGAYERGEVAGVELLTAADVANERFAQTKFRAGWDQDEVDDLLDDVAFTLRSFETAASDTP